MALSKEELEARQKAIDSGKYRYIRKDGGESYDIRNINNPRLQDRYEGQGGTDERTASRIANRGNKDGIRNQRINGQTNPNADRKAASDFKAKVNGNGNHHHHKAPIARVDNGLGKKYGYPLPKEIHNKFNKNGTFFGDDVRNFQELTPEEHITNTDSVHRQIDNLDNGIKRAKGSFNGLRIRAGGLPQLMRGSRGFIVMDIVEAVDAQTNGAISESINGVVNGIKNGINNGLNGLYDFATDNGIIGLPTLDTEAFINNAPIKKGGVSYGLPTLTIPTRSDGL